MPSIRRVPSLVVLVAFLVAALPSLASAYAPIPGRDGGEAADSVQPSPRIPNHYIVVFKDSVAGPKTVALAQTEQQDGDLGFVYTHAIKGYSAELSKDAVEALRRNPKVDYVIPDRKVEVQAQTVPTGIRRISADKNTALDIDETDDVRVNADVAVIDTGIDYTHPDLNVAGRTNCVPTDENPNTKACVDNSGIDGYGHGTHVAGTVGALDNGIGVVGAAPGVRLWAVRVFNNEGEASDSWILAAVDWVTAHASEIEVANMSLGSPGGRSPAYDAAITASVEAGVIYAVAAGNDSANAETQVPANSPDVITVSALADTDGQAGGKGGQCHAPADDTLASFSNWGSSVELAAPGACIRSTLPVAGSVYGANYGTVSGTSMASPHVAGAAAVLASKSNPNSKADVEAIKKTLIDGGSLDWNDTKEDGKPEPLLYLGNEPISSVEVETGGWSSLNSTSATMAGALNTRGLSTQYHFEYGPTASYGQTTSPTTVGSGTKYASVTAAADSFQPSEPYHYRIAATTSQGTVYGRDRLFVPSLWATQSPTGEPNSPYSLSTEVSCPSATFCVAVGHSYLAEELPLSYTLSGGQWKYSKMLLPEGGLYPEITSIDCAASNACTAVGKVQSASGKVVPLVERWNGTNWSIQSVPEPPSESTLPYAKLGDVSCPSAAECVAVGYFQGVDEEWTSFSSLWKSGKWTNSYPLPSGGLLEGVSCISSSFCMGVGTGQGHNMQWNGSSWSALSPASPGLQMKKVACTSASFCLAVSTEKYLEAWDGTAWSTEGTKWSHYLSGSKWTVADLRPENISCASTTDCVIVGTQWEDKSERPVPLVAMWNGSSVTYQPTLRNIEEWGIFNGVDCYAQSLCVAAGHTGGATTKPLIATTPDWRPAVGKTKATDVKFDSAVLRGAVNPNGLSTSYAFEYGMTSAYGSKVPISAPEAIGSGTSEVQMSQSVSGLKPDTTYHFRVAATNAGGTRVGPDQELRTVLPGKATFSKDLGSTGAGEGQLSEPRGIAVDGQDNLYVADYDNHRVQKLDPDGKYMAQIKHVSDGHPEIWPYDVAIDSKANVYVASGYSSRVEKFSSAGAFLAEYKIPPTTQVFPESIALDASGSMYIAGSWTGGGGGVAKLSPTGETLAVFGVAAGEGHLTDPGGIALGPEGNLYVSDSGGDRVAKFDTAGKYLGQIGSAGTGAGKLDNPRGLDIGPEGNLFVADANNHRVEVFKLGGEYLAQIGVQGPGAAEMLAPVGIAFGSKGEIYVTDNEGDVVHKWLQPVSSLPYAVSQPALVGMGGGATFKGSVYPSGLATTYKFEYGTTTSYGTSVPVSPKSIGSGYGEVEVSEAISGLSPSTSYHFRLVAQNSAGTFTTGDREFTIQAIPTNTGLPVISPSTPLQNVPASTTNGTWTQKTTIQTYQYQWKRCNAVGAECVNIVKNAKEQTYKPTAADVEGLHTLRVEVTASNESWSASATSAASNVVKPIGEVSEFSLPAGSEARGITAGPDGNLWFADYPVGKIGKITTSGTITEYALGAGSKPWAITVGPEGKLWYTFNDNIGVMSTSGAVEASYALPIGSSPRGITKGPDGNLWFCNFGTNKIGKITPAGVKTEYAVTGSKPIEITSGPDGNLWFVTEVGNTVGKITTSGTVTEYSLGAGSQPAAITKGPDENLWVAQPGTDRIAKVTTAGTITQYTLSENANPYGIAPGADGALWFTMEGKIGGITTAGFKNYYSLPVAGGANKIVSGPDSRLWFTRGNGKVGAIVP